MRHLSILTRQYQCHFYSIVPPRSMRSFSRPRAFRKGFTLVEVAIATSIIGLGVVAVMAACQARTQAIAGSSQLSRAVFLAQEIREWTIKLPFSDPDEADAGNPPGSDPTDPPGVVDDLDDLLGATFDPPKSGYGAGITDMVGWSETITLTWVNPQDLTVVAPGGSDVVQVEVGVEFNDRQVLSTGWLVIRRQDQ